MDDVVEDGASTKPVDAKDVRDTIDEIVGADTKPKWQIGIQIDLGTKRWRPSAVSEDQSRLLYVCGGASIPQFVVQRLRMARAKGVDVVVGLTLTSLYDSDVLDVLADCEADVMVLDDYRTQNKFKRRHFLAAIADIEIPVEPQVRKRVAKQVWANMSNGTSHQKGRRLEALTAFLFSQVRDLKVVSRNYRNETEEIDIVLQVDNFSNRVWQLSCPFILVEAKNREEKASQPMMSGLIAKLQTKRGTSRIAIMVSPAGFTDDAKLQELRFSSGDLCVAMIDRDAMDRLVDADDIDDVLEDIVRSALLR